MDKSAVLVLSMMSLYTSYDPQIRAEVGKYTSIHGVAAASRVYSKKLDQNVSQSTVRSIMEAYIKELKK